MGMRRGGGEGVPHEGVATLSQRARRLLQRLPQDLTAERLGFDVMHALLGFRLWTPAPSHPCKLLAGVGRN